MAHERRHLLRVLPALALLSMSLSAGCLWLRDVDALSSGGSETDAAPDAAPGDAPNDAPDTGNATDAGFWCPGDAGPRAVRIGAYCIDSTEVTVGDYRAFLVARGGDTSGQPAVCAWNDDFAPGNEGIPGTDQDGRPIANVDYCDALAFCAWAGKRLCGAIDGGAGHVEDFGSASKSQWYRACSHNADGLHAWPYGIAYEPSTCNGADRDAGGSVTVGSLPGCIGGYDGVFDMSGNLREWEDACDLAGDPDASTCLVRGGAFYDEAEGTLSCNNRQVMPMTTTSFAVGFRCCSP